MPSHAQGAQDPMSLWWKEAKENSSGSCHRIHPPKEGREKERNTILNKCHKSATAQKEEMKKKKKKLKKKEETDQIEKGPKNFERNNNTNTEGEKKNFFFLFGK